MVMGIQFLLKKDGSGFDFIENPGINAEDQKSNSYLNTEFLPLEFGKNLQKTLNSFSGNSYVELAKTLEKFANSNSIRKYRSQSEDRIYAHYHFSNELNLDQTESKLKDQYNELKDKMSSPVYKMFHIFGGMARDTNQLEDLRDRLEKARLCQQELLDSKRYEVMEEAGLQHLKGIISELKAQAPELDRNVELATFAEKIEKFDEVKTAALEEYGSGRIGLDSTAGKFYYNEGQKIFVEAKDLIKKYGEDVVREFSTDEKYQSFLNDDMPNIENRPLTRLEENKTITKSLSTIREMSMILSEESTDERIIREKLKLFDQPHLIKEYTKKLEDAKLSLSNIINPGMPIDEQNLVKDSTEILFERLSNGLDEAKSLMENLKRSDSVDTTGIADRITEVRLELKSLLPHIANDTLGSAETLRKTLLAMNPGLSSRASSEFSTPEMS